MQNKVPVLVVDDSPTIRKLLVKCMEGDNYDVDEADNAMDAVKLAKGKKYHLILLDVIMPEVDGYEACKIIKKGGKSENTPVIFISGEESEEANFKGHDAGSVDYLTKPINMKQLSLKASVHVQNSLLLQELEQYQSRMQMDIKKATSFYHAFLPEKQYIKKIEEKHSVNINAYFTPFNQIGGDFWKIKDIDEHRFGVFAADFSGHGVASALNVAYLNAILSKTIEWSDPVKVMKFINQDLTEALPVGSFATAIYFVFNSKNKTVSYVNCASPYMILSNQSGSDVEYQQQSSQPLGIWESDEMDIQPTEIKIKNGDNIFIYSDLLLESTHTPNKERWMLEGLKEKISQLKEPAKYKLKELKSIFLETASQPLEDDLTMISICLKEE